MYKIGTTTNIKNNWGDLKWNSWKKMKKKRIKPKLGGFFKWDFRFFSGWFFQVGFFLTQPCPSPSLVAQCKFFFENRTFFHSFMSSKIHEFIQMKLRLAWICASSTFILYHSQQYIFLLILSPPYLETIIFSSNFPPPLTDRVAEIFLKIELS